MGILDNLEPKAVFKHFENLCAIPRASGNEAAAAGYCEKQAEKMGLKVLRDPMNNVIISKPGKGDKTVILQGHLDMVCEKDSGNIHDFTNDPLSIRVEGGFITAADTTLGADNGIGAAMALALLEEGENIPSIKALLTTNEETGMEGAHAVPPEWLAADYLINLDTEEEGVFIAGCAGGAKPRVTLPITREGVTPGSGLFKAGVFGLIGGHSGADIEKGRANACVVLGRVLERLLRIEGVQIISVDGGARDNAIPREGSVVFAAPKDKGYALFEAIGSLSLSLKREYRDSDPGVCIALYEYNGEPPRYALSTDSANKAACMVNLMPCGVIELSRSLGIVETSNNLGQITTSESDMVFLCASRSNAATRLDWVLEKISRLASALGASVDVGGAYPGWEYCPDSRLLKTAKESYLSLRGKPARVSAIHAGLECGLLLEKNPRLDAISIGPDIFGAHTPGERASVDSASRVYALLKDILARLV